MIFQYEWTLSYILFLPASCLSLIFRHELDKANDLIVMVAMYVSKKQASNECVKFVAFLMVSLFEHEIIVEMVK